MEVYGSRPFFRARKASRGMMQVAPARAPCKLLRGGGFFIWLSGTFYGRLSQSLRGYVAKACGTTQVLGSLGLVSRLCPVWMTVAWWTTDSS